MPKLLSKLHNQRKERFKLRFRVAFSVDIGEPYKAMGTLRLRGLLETIGSYRQLCYPVGEPR